VARVPVAYHRGVEQLDESSKAVVKKLREWAGDLARAIGNKQKCMNILI
jgi:hypothetical protein